MGRGLFWTELLRFGDMRMLIIGAMNELGQIMNANVFHLHSRPFAFIRGSVLCVNGYRNRYDSTHTFCGGAKLINFCRCLNYGS